MTRRIIQENIMSDRNVLNETRDQTADVAYQVKSAAEDLYGQARDSASQIADAARRSTKIPRQPLRRRRAA